MITFLGLPERTAGLIRGKQIAEKISGSEFLDVNSRQSAKNDTCIFVRNHFIDAAKYYKSQGKKIGYDICDMPVGDVIFRNEKNPSIGKFCYDIYDFYIVNNQTSYLEAISATTKPVYIIPHHTVNVDRKRNQVKSEVKTVGYVGLKEQFSKAIEVEDFLKSKNISFLNVHPSTREECDKTFQEIDIGVIFFDHSSSSEEIIAAVKKYKPNTKLSNFQSYGIPTLCISYDSFKQFGENAYMEIDSYESLLKNISLLINSKFMRSDLSEKSYEVGQKFHIDQIVKHYVKILDKHD